MCDDRYGKGVIMYLGNVGEADSVFRAMTAAQWTAGDYELLSGQYGVETDTGRCKVGTGGKWSATSYIGPAGITDDFVFNDGDAVTHSVTIVNGIITSWTF